MISPYYIEVENGSFIRITIAASVLRTVRLRLRGGDATHLVYQTFQSRGYCSNEVMIPWKLVSLSSSVMLSQAASVSHPVHGLSIWFSLSITYMR